MSARNGVSWKWLAGILVSVLLLAGAGWIGSIQTEQSAERAKREEQSVGLGVVREKIERIEEQVREIRQDQKEHNKKLDELLRRVR